jgi:16S rRNA (guanine527-N7)-methyltransferase
MMQPALSKALTQNQMAVAPAQQEQLLQFLELLQTWNRVFNLTTITHPHDMIYLHLIDSLAVQPYLHGSRLLDVGSGGGLPGLPLAIINPHQQWILLDKNSKKTRFITQAIAELGLNNAQAVHSRCEDFQPERGFDSIISRAFGSIRLFVDTTLHLLNPNGQFLAMKGKLSQEELDDIPNSIKAQHVVRLEMKGIDIERHIVCLRTA